MSKLTKQLSILHMALDSFTKSLEVQIALLEKEESTPSTSSNTASDAIALLRNLLNEMKQSDDPIADVQVWQWKISTFIDAQQHP